MPDAEARMLELQRSNATPAKTLTRESLDSIRTDRKESANGMPKATDQSASDLQFFDF